MCLTYQMIESWANKEGNVNSIGDILAWVKERDENLRVNIRKEKFSYNGFWYYDKEDGCIRNKRDSFFRVKGFQVIEDDKIMMEQPIIIQDEIGYLGIICKEIDGVINFLMQAKVEPGNINKIQISPTLQATKSNFMKRHGGTAPAYLEYFANASKYTILYDQIQSEQSSRFYKKRNRNMIIFVDDDVEVLDSHKWMTLGQIKDLMKYDNLVNMDTRTVLSGLPFFAREMKKDELEKAEKLFKDKALFKSLFATESYEDTRILFNKLNDAKMYQNQNSRLLPLTSLKSWKMTDEAIECKSPYDFKVIYCYIEIEGREVQYWEQPLFEACGQAVFGLFTCVDRGIRKYLVNIKPEVGCFDYAELGPTVQMEPTNKRNEWDSVEHYFMKKLNDKNGIIIDTILSEEGGRFYHEQNRNVIIEIDKSELDALPETYFWVNAASVNRMIQANNVLNIQLRNLFSLVEV